MPTNDTPANFLSLSLVKETFVSLAEILFEGVNAYQYHTHIIETSKEREICVPGRLETCLEAIIIESRLKERCSKTSYLFPFITLSRFK